MNKCKILGVLQVLLLVLTINIFAADGTKKFLIDDFKLIALLDGNNPMPAALFSDAEPAVIAELLPNGTAAASVNVFLVQKDGKNILFDAGNGAAHGGKLIERLADAGVKPEEIDMIFMTHLHPDHIGGLLNKGKVVFANAELYVADAECNGWTGDKVPAAMRNMIKGLLKAYSAKLHRFNFDETLPCGIKPVAAFGHSAGHTVYELSNLVVIGDILHAAVLQIPHPEYCSRYDANKKQSIESRLKIYKYIADNHKFTAASHMPFPGVLTDKESEIFKR